jgi:hemerythrin superfamily protein
MTRSAKSHGSTHDAIALLKADHHAVKAMFHEFSSADAEERHGIAGEICTALTIHAQIEEEILYPAARETLGTKAAALLDEALVEHGTAKDLIAKIETSAPEHPLYVAWVTVLGEYIQHHVAEEEGELFPKLRISDMDLAAVGATLASRKAELTKAAKHGKTADGEPASSVRTVAPRAAVRKSDGAKRPASI